jgi:hypothetical protein
MKFRPSDDLREILTFGLRVILPQVGNEPRGSPIPAFAKLIEQLSSLAMAQADFRISRSVVRGFDDDSLFWAVVEPIWPDMRVQNELAHIAQGTAGQRAVYSTMLFAREVDNGGLQQFLGNSSGLYWRNVVEGLELLGADKHLSALNIILAVFPESAPSLEQGERQAVLRNLDETQKKSLRDAEDSLYRAGGFEQLLVPLWKRYIEAHPAEFFRD